MFFVEFELSTTTEKIYIEKERIVSLTREVDPDPDVMLTKIEVEGSENGFHIVKGSVASNYQLWTGLDL